jgi:hypothetical protein
MKKADQFALDTMRSCDIEGTRWAAYQNMDLGSSNAGHTQYLAVGPNNTHKTPPSQMPDTSAGLGWRYKFIGYVNIETGEVTNDDI